MLKISGGGGGHPSVKTLLNGLILPMLQYTNTYNKLEVPLRKGEVDAL